MLSFGLLPQNVSHNFWSRNFHLASIFAKFQCMVIWPSYFYAYGKTVYYWTWQKRGCWSPGTRKWREEVHSYKPNCESIRRWIHWWDQSLQIHSPPNNSGTLLHWRSNLQHISLGDILVTYNTEVVNGEWDAKKKDLNFPHVDLALELQWLTSLKLQIFQWKELSIIPVSYAYKIFLWQENSIPYAFVFIQRAVPKSFQKSIITGNSIWAFLKDGYICVCENKRAETQSRWLVPVQVLILSLILNILGSWWSSLSSQCQATSSTFPAWPQVPESPTDLF